MSDDVDQLEDSEARQLGSRRKPELLAKKRRQVCVFGYVMANRGELSEEEYARYRACYCGLCRALGQCHGQTKRSVLNYDFTFLILLLSSLYEPEEDTGTIRCPAHPTTAHPYWHDSFTDYAADMNVILAYYSLLDHWIDDKSLRGWIGTKMLMSDMAKVAQRYPRQGEAIREGLADIDRMQEAESRDIDALAASFGRITASMFVYDDTDRFAPELWDMADNLGRFIYVMDAYDDIEKDVKKGRFNALVETYEDPDFDDECHDILALLMGECCSSFEKLPLVQDLSIMRNILYSGVWSRYLMRRTAKDERAKRFGKGGSSGDGGSAVPAADVELADFEDADQPADGDKPAGAGTDKPEDGDKPAGADADKPVQTDAGGDAR